MNPALDRATPSLRIEEFAITNFRTFVRRTVIPFRGMTSGSADEVATFHGDNGSGKSNAIAALKLFFDALIFYLRRDYDSQRPAIMLAWALEDRRGEVVISPRDRPGIADEPTVLEVLFSDKRLGAFRVQITPSGSRARLLAEVCSQVERDEPRSFLPIVERDKLLTWLETPFGLGSSAYSVLNAHRRDLSPGIAAGGNTWDVLLVEELLLLRTALNTQSRARWRIFIETLEGFPTFKGKIISVDRLPNGHATLTVEEPNRYVLSLEELSSGEQQLVRLCALTVLRNSALLAIEEPELSLDVKSQRLLLSVLSAQLSAGIRDQVILESHVPSFDSASVIRFERTPTGETRVTREVANRGDPGIAEKAKEQQAEERWVTADGYTQLPESMRSSLGLTAGGHLWFLKGRDTWEAWVEGDLKKLLAHPVKDGDDE